MSDTEGVTKRNALLLLAGIIALGGCAQTATTGVPTLVQGNAAPSQLAQGIVKAITGDARGSRDTARALRAQSDARLAAGDYKGAMDKRLQILSVRAGDASMLGALTEYGLQQLAVGDLAAIASHLDAPSCRKYAAQLKAWDARMPSYAAVIQSEKAHELKEFDHLVSKPQLWQGVFTDTDWGFSKQQQAILRKTPIAQIRKNIVTIYDVRIRRSTQPYSNQKFKLAIDPYTRFVTQTWGFRFVWTENKTERLLTIVGLQERADRLEKRKRSEPLPTDPFGKGALRQKNGVIYSVGPDTRDDGGKPVPSPKLVQDTDKGDIPAPSF